MPRKPSAARKWCKICKVWIADNRVQREQHEQAKRHKEALQTLLREIADRNQQKAEREETSQKMETQPSRTAAVTKLLLEHVASVPAKVAREMNPDNVNIADGEDGERPVKTTYGNSGEEVLDTNGYPLPASAVYGTWKTVEDDDARSVKDNNGTNDKTGKNNASCANNTSQESTHSADNENEECVTRITGEGEQALEEDELAHINFKRRVAPRTRRIRKKARR